MSEKYIRQNKTSHSIVKNSRTLAKITNLEDAIFIRDLLIDSNWDLKNIPQILKKDDKYMVLTVYDDKIFILAKYKQKPDENTISKLVKRHERNPNNSKYGLNISRIMDTFIITKQIAGEVIIVSEEVPVSDTDAAALFQSVIRSVNAGQVKQQVLAMALLNDRPDDDGIIRRNLIIRWFEPLKG